MDRSPLSLPHTLFALVVCLVGVGAIVVLDCWSIVHEFSAHALPKWRYVRPSGVAP